jgi:hypothetical protein
MMQEADALGIERQKVRWHNEGVGIRDAMVAKQMFCLQEKFDRTWAAMVPTRSQGRGSGTQ